jgi:hypothetical protein
MGRITQDDWDLLGEVLHNGFAVANAKFKGTRIIEIIVNGKKHSVPCGSDVSYEWLKLAGGKMQHPQASVVWATSDGQGELIAE